MIWQAVPLVQFLPRTVPKGCAPPPLRGFSYFCKRNNRKDCAVGHGWLMMTDPCRFDTSIPCKPAAVAIYVDGSVLVYAAGAEVGQGLTTKVKQVRLDLLPTIMPSLLVCCSKA